MDEFILFTEFLWACFVTKILSLMEFYCKILSLTGFVTKILCLVNFIYKIFKSGLFAEIF